MQPLYWQNEAGPGDATGPGCVLGHLSLSLGSQASIGNESSLILRKVRQVVGDIPGS